MTNTDLRTSSVFVGSQIGVSISWKRMTAFPRVARKSVRAKRSSEVCGTTPAIVLKTDFCAGPAPSEETGRSSLATSAFAVSTTQTSSSVAFRASVSFTVRSLKSTKSRYSCFRRASTSSSLYSSTTFRNPLTSHLTTSSPNTVLSSSVRNLSMRSISSTRCVYLLYGRCVLREFMSSSCTFACVPSSSTNSRAWSIGSTMVPCLMGSDLRIPICPQRCPYRRAAGTRPGTIDA
mmetsp:Transcript_17181/g.48875  ORF Transcript_17181/g.48875 Transcript_17181/m.48875 type:complete len:234 (-) Transcript_17181:6-707(-)